MSYRLITRVEDPSEAARLRAIISGSAPMAAVRPAPKRLLAAPSGQEVVRQFVAFRDDTWTIQCPITVHTAHAKGSRFGRVKLAAKQIDGVLMLLRANLRAVSGSDDARALIRGITLVRLSPGMLSKHDGIRSAFEHVLDAVCAWIVEGDREIPLDRRGRRTCIGKYDDKILTTGTMQTGKVTCSYEQMQCPENPKAHGIQIRLHTKSA